MAYRCLDPTKVLLTSPTRLRLSCVAIPDVVTFDGNSANPLSLIAHYQQEDLIALGKLVLALACRSLLAVHRDNMQASLELVTRSYSADLRNLILYVYILSFSLTLTLNINSSFYSVTSNMMKTLHDTFLHQFNISLFNLIYL